MDRGIKMDALPRILVIEDDPGLLLKTSQCLRKAGYPVLEAESGVEGLRLAGEHLPDLILLTEDLSDIAYDTVCVRIKQDPVMTGSLVVILTTHAPDSVECVMLARKADGVIRRSIPDHDFLSRIETILRIEHTLPAQSMMNNQSILTAVVENTDTSVWAVDQQYRLLFSNSVFREECRTGFGREIALGESVLLEILPQSECEEWQKYYNRAFLGEQYNFERRRKYCATTLWNEYHCSPIINEEGHSIGAVVVAYNITERKRAEEARQRRAEELAALQATVLEITVRQKLPDLLQTIVERAVALLGATSGGMYLCIPHSKTVRCVVSYNTSRDYTGTVLAYGEGAAGTVAVTGEPLIVDDYRVWDNRAAVYEEDQPFSALLCAPMLWQDQVTGVIDVLDDMDNRHFTEDDLALLMQFASHASIAVENTRLFEAAQNEISERMRIEAALRQSEARTRSILQVAPIGIGLVSSRILLDVNGYLCKITGYARDELIGKNARVLYPSDTEYDYVGTEKYRQIQAGGTGSVETHFRRKDGEIIDVLLSSTPLDPDDLPAGVTFAVLDITERKRMEMQLVEERNLLRTVIDNLPDYIYAKDTESRFVLGNSASMHSTGLEVPEELLGKRDFDFYPRELAEQYFADEQKVIQSGEALIEHEEPFVDHATGRQGWQTTTKVPLRDGSGKIVGIVGIGRDITERKQAEKVLRTYSEQLEEMVETRTRALQDAQEKLVRREKLAVLGQLAGGVGHELRNPLGAIKNAAYFLHMVLENPNNEVREMLRTLEHEVGIAEKIISGLLDFATTKSPERHRVHVNDVIKEALSRVTLPTAPTVQVSLQFQDDLPAILADHNQLIQIFSNLILNGVQAMPDGGHLIIKTSLDDSGCVRVSITDTGLGIPEDNRKKLFEPLFTTKTGGVGLGLVVVKTLVEGHGGTVVVESQVGKGSTFKVKLPVQKSTR